MLHTSFLVLRDCEHAHRNSLAGVIQGSYGQQAINYATPRSTAMRQSQQWPQQQPVGMHQRWDEHGAPIQHMQQVQNQAWTQTGSRLQQPLDPGQAPAMYQQQDMQLFRMQQQQQQQQGQQAVMQPPAVLHLQSAHYMMQLQAGQDSLSEGGCDVGMKVDVDTVTVQMAQQQVAVQQQRRVITADILSGSGWSHEELIAATGGIAAQRRHHGQQQRRQQPGSAGSGPLPHLHNQQEVHCIAKARSPTQPAQSHVQVAQAGPEPQVQQYEQQPQADSISGPEEGEVLPDDAGAKDEQHQQDQQELTRKDRQRLKREAAAAAKREQEALQLLQRLESLGDGVARHPLQLNSAYVAVTGSEPAFSSVHHKFNGTLVSHSCLFV